MRLRVFGIGLATVLLGGCVPSDEPLQHGTIKLDPRPLEGQGSGVFNGTTEVLMIMRYEQCLADFYQREPSWRADGIDGSPIFGSRDEGGEGWLDRLCEDLDRDQAACEVVYIDQQLDLDPQLHVRVKIDNPNLEPSFLKFGPVPLEGLAGCRPMMRVSINPVQGFSGSTRIWDTKTFTDNVAEPNQGGRVRVRVGTLD
jgi:hypothetical protein